MKSPHLDNNQELFSFSPGLQILKNLQPVEIQAVCDLHVAWARKDKDTLLVRGEDPARALLTLTKGIAFKYCMIPNGGRQILSLYLPGDTIGLDGLLAGSPSYPVRSAGSVTYSIMGHEKAVHLAREASWFRDKILAVLAGERAAAEMAIIRLGQCDAEQRVASIFVDLYHRLAERGLAQHNEFVLELTQQHLADLLGLTPVHLNRVLGRLRSRGLLAITGQRVQIVDMDALEFHAVLRTAPAELAMAG